LGLDRKQRVAQQLEAPPHRIPEAREEPLRAAGHRDGARAGRRDLSPLADLLGDAGRNAEGLAHRRRWILGPLLRRNPAVVVFLLLGRREIDVAQVEALALAR